jgi:dTDP-4-dehydrorhamnose 3,5-epimerase-like enzyme
MTPEKWFEKVFPTSGTTSEQRPYHLEQWDVMFFLTSRCEFFLIDERAGMPRRKMRFSISGDSHPGPDNIAIIIPPGVAHALTNLGNEDLIMVYGTSTSFNPLWEGRIESNIERCSLPNDWERYFNSPL